MLTLPFTHQEFHTCIRSALRRADQLMCGKPPAFRHAVSSDEASPFDREAEPRDCLEGDLEPVRRSLTAHQAAEPRPQL